MVDVDCGSYTPEGVNRIADLCQERFERGGWAAERIPHRPGEGEPQLGDLLIGRLDGGGGSRVLLIGHTDTVFDPGTVAERPFRTDGDRAYGPGASDMKGGLLAGFHAIEVLREAGFEEFGRITYVCNPDEELGSPFSTPRIRAEAEEADVALVLECGRPNGGIVTSRKGVTDVRIHLRGRAAHAGVEPEKGRSAVLEAAHQVLALHELNGRWPGVTVNAGVIHGGTRHNVVAASCEIGVDVRAPQEEHLRAAEDAIRAIAADPTTPDVTAEVEFGPGFRPMERTEAAARLARLARDVGERIGIDLPDVATGGASDANTTSAAGTPSLDGLGPIGGDDHAPGEWLDLASVAPRIALLAGVISRVHEVL